MTDDDKQTLAAILLVLALGFWNCIPTIAALAAGPQW